MKAWYEGHGGREEFDISKPSDFFPAVADKIARKEQNVNATVRAGIDDTHYAEWSVCVRSGTQAISQTVNMMPAEYTEKEEAPVYLGNIDALTNAYKHYLMYPNPKKGIVHCVYGRNSVGNAGPFRDRSCDWPIEMFPVKKREKIAKGYVDISEYMFADDETDKGTEISKEHTPSADLFRLLTDYALRHVRHEIEAPVNEKIIAKAEELIQCLKDDSDADDRDKFNEDLKFLMLILQRRIETGDGMGVSRMLAHSSDDFYRIICRETALCNAMKGSVAKDGAVSGDFSDYGVEVFDATDEQKKFVMRHLSDRLKGMVKHVWRVNPKKQRNSFEQYLKDRDIDNVRCLWHGSLNSSWGSILKAGGLRFKNDSEATGNMFGGINSNGRKNPALYFAESPEKSFNYTSFHGTRWAHGTEDTALMGLFATGFGKPYEITSWSASCDYKKAVEDGGYGCLYAKKAQGFLLNDEVVFYREDASCLLYLVEFEA